MRYKMNAFIKITMSFQFELQKLLYNCAKSIFLFFWAIYLNHFFYLCKLYTDAKPGLVKSEADLNDNTEDFFRGTIQNDSTRQTI